MPSRFVRNTKVPAWGTGLVLSEKGDQIEVHFEFGGRRKLSTRIAAIEEVDVADLPPESPLRDPDFGTGRAKRAASTTTRTAPGASRSSTTTSTRAADPGVRTRTTAGSVRNPGAVQGQRRVAAEVPERFAGSKRLPHLMQKFRDHFPRGLADPLVDLEERRTLRAVAADWRQTVTATALRDALASESTEDLVDSITDLLERSTLLSPIDISRLKAMPPDAEPAFLRAVELLQAAGAELPTALDDAAEQLAAFDLARWGVLSAIALFIDPTRWVLVRPDTLPLVAGMLAFDLAWETRPNTYTYRRAMLFLASLRSELASRGETASDPIDLAIFLKHAVG